MHNFASDLNRKKIKKILTIGLNSLLRLEIFLLVYNLLAILK